MTPDLSSISFERQPTYTENFLAEATERLARAAMLEMDRRIARWIEFTQPPGYWEHELALRIEERRVRHWPRRAAERVRSIPGRLAAKWRYSRYATAISVLRGTHYCGDDW